MRLSCIITRITRILERLRVFSPIYLNILDTVEKEIFFFCANLVIFCHGSISKAFFDAFLNYGLPGLIEDDSLGTLRP